MSSLPPVPPHYLPLLIAYIDQAYAPDKPNRVLLASFVRLLCLGWQQKFESTPKLLEEELYNTTNKDGTTKFGYLKLSRREYFTQKREMELLGWLRSNRPATGFVQFIFNRPVELSPAIEELEMVSAENRTGGAENRTELKRIEEEENLKFKNQESSSSSLKQSEVRKTALTPSEARMQRLLENLHLLFDPELHGVLEIRPILLAGIPDRALAWIAKAYQERERLSQPIGLIVKHIAERDEPNRYYMGGKAFSILPEEYLEAAKEIEHDCGYCDQKFGARADLEKHLSTDHCLCMECWLDFPDDQARKAHYAADHEAYRDRLHSATIEAPALDGTIETAWVHVLKLLQADMPRASFDTWVRDTTIVRYDGNAVTIGTRNSYARSWLVDRLSDRVRQLLSQVLEKPVTVIFVVQSESQLIELEEKSK